MSVDVDVDNGVMATRPELKLTAEFGHLAAKEELGLDGAVLDGVFIEVLEDNGVTGARGGFGRLGRLYGRVRGSGFV